MSLRSLVGAIEQQGKDARRVAAGEKTYKPDKHAKTL